MPTPSLDTVARLHREAAQLVRLGAWQCELEGNVLTWTDGVYDLFELARGSALHRPSIVDLYTPEARRAMETKRAALVATGRGFTLDAEIVTSRGERRWMRLAGEAEFAQGRPIRIYGAKQDVTAERLLWDRLRRLAETDPLTGLGNRRGFDQRLRTLLDRPLAAGEGFALVLVDLDHFKQVNDRHGHAAGDECLRQVARRIARAFPGAIESARIGGDEFAVLVPLRGSVARAAWMDAAVAALCGSVAFGRHWLELSVSVGAAIAAPAHRERPAALFADADAALYLAKAEGRACGRFFGARLGRSPLTALHCARAQGSLPS